MLNTRYKAVQRFMRKHKYVYHQRTNEATRAPQEVMDEAMDFIIETRPLLVGAHRDPRYIWNMDQMPLSFSYQSSKMLAKHGAKTVNMRKTTDGTKRAMAALTVTTAGDFLMPMIIFKGKPTNAGCVDRRALHAHVGRTDSCALSFGNPPQAPFQSSFSICTDAT